MGKKKGSKKDKKKKVVVHDNEEEDAKIVAMQHYNVGDNLRHKAFYEEAIDELRKALLLLQHQQHEHSSTSAADNNIAIARTQYSLGLAYRATKDFSRAMNSLTTALEIYEAASSRPKEKKDNDDDDDDEDPTKNGNSDSNKKLLLEQIKNCKLNIARVHHSLGVLYQRGGSYDNSVVEHRKALALRESLLGRSHVETARSHYVMGCALSDRGDFDEALGELRRALRVRLLVFGKNHHDTTEVVQNIGTVLAARGGSLNAESISEYQSIVIRSIEYELEGDVLCSREKEEYEDSMILYRKALSLEMQYLGDLHPTSCDIYLRMAEALGEFGDLEASLVEYKSAIAIYERTMGKFHVSMAKIYSKLAGVLMDKGEYETALSFYSKAYCIYDVHLGRHDDTKQALQKIKLAAGKNRAAKSSMAILVKAEEEFQRRHSLSSAAGGCASSEAEGFVGDAPHHDNDIETTTALMNGDKKIPTTDEESSLLLLPMMSNGDDDCVADLIPEYGVIHLRNALSDDEQKLLWERTKPHVKDPKGKNTGFSAFAISSGKHNRDEVMDRFGELLFTRSAKELTKQLSDDECRKEPSYHRLSQILTGTKPVSLNCVTGNYYRPDATLSNHRDMKNKALFTMSVALGDDIEFTVGKRIPGGSDDANRSNSDGPGKSGKTLIMKSGDAVFFDGGNVPHEVGKILPNTAPSWWESQKVPNGARCVVLFREDVVGS